MLSLWLGMLCFYSVFSNHPHVYNIQRKENRGEEDEYTVLVILASMLVGIGNTFSKFCVLYGSTQYQHVGDNRNKDC